MFFFLHVISKRLSSSFDGDLYAQIASGHDLIRDVESLRVHLDIMSSGQPELGEGMFEECPARHMRRLLSRLRVLRGAPQALIEALANQVQAHNL